MIRSAPPKGIIRKAAAAPYPGMPGTGGTARGKGHEKEARNLLVAGVFDIWFFPKLPDSLCVLDVQLKYCT